MQTNEKNIKGVESGETISSGRRTQVLIAVAIGTFMSALDSSVVNIALPKISTHFNSPLSTVEWVIMSYLLIISSLLLTYGRFGDMYGHKKVYITGFIIFTAGSLLCATAPAVMLLIIFRGLQAIGAGMLMAMGPAIVTDITPPEKRGRALGVTAVAVSVALATGPVVGGFLVSNFNWSSIFYINIPIGIIGTIWGAKVIPVKKSAGKQIFDIKGAVVVFLALVCILMPLSYTDNYGWDNLYIIGALVLGIILLGVFVRIEKKTEHAMVDLTLFNNKLFSMSNLSALLNYMAQFSVVFLMPFYLQQLRGLDPSRAGLMIIPMPLVTMLIAPISGSVSDRVDARYISSLGMAITTVGILLLSKLSVSSSNLTIALSLAVVGLGIGLFQTPNNSAIMGAVPNYRRGIASGMLATMRNIGMVLGVAISGAIFSNRLNYLNSYLPLKGVTGVALKNQSFIGALHLTYIIGAIFAAVAVVTSLVRGSMKTKQEMKGSH